MRDNVPLVGLLLDGGDQRVRLVLRQVEEGRHHARQVGRLTNQTHIRVIKKVHEILRIKLVDTHVSPWQLTICWS